MMPFGQQQGPAPVLNQPDQRMSLARLLMPQQPAGGGMGSVFNPAKILDFASMVQKNRAPAPQAPGAGPDMSGNVMDPSKPFGKFANWLAGSEGLLGSNGFMARQFGAQPSAMNQYSGPPVGADPLSAYTVPGQDPGMAIPSRWGG